MRYAQRLLYKFLRLTFEMRWAVQHEHPRKGKGGSPMDGCRRGFFAIRRVVREKQLVVRVVVANHETILLAINDLENVYII